MDPLDRRLEELVRPPLPDDLARLQSPPASPPAEHHVHVTIHLHRDIPRITKDRTLTLSSRQDYSRETLGVNAVTRHGRIFLPWSNVAGIVTQLDREA